MSKWTSVEERLPKYGKKVLCYSDTEEFIVGYRENQFGHLVWTTGGIGSGTFHVTHWMPLPRKPYKV